MNMKDMFVYQCSPIDYYFMATIPVEELFCVDKNEMCRYQPSELFELIGKCFNFVAIAKGSYWDGEVRNLRVFGIPSGSAQPPRLGLIWSQYNDGITFICSPVELPWIQGDAEEQGTRLFIDNNKSCK